MRERLLRQLAALREKHEREIRRLIARAARIGVRSQDIAAALGISRATLWRRYRSDLAYGPDHEPPAGDRARRNGRAAARL